MAGFQLGELILSSKPYAYALYPKYIGLYCDYCCKKNADLKRCCQCCYAHYCNKACQKEGWLQHKNECKYIKKAGTYFADIQCSFPELRLISLTIFKIKKQGKEVPYEEVYGRKVSYSTLMSHAEDIKNDAKRCLFIQALETVLKQYIEPVNVPSLDELIELFGKLFTNSFKIESGFTSIGSGLYLSASIFDHSCDFDAYRSFDGPILNIRMVKNLPHRDIKKVCLTYTDVSKYTEERQADLKENFLFTCQCPFCTTFKFDDLKGKLFDDSEEAKRKAHECKKKLEYIKKRREDPETDPEIIYQFCKETLKIQNEIMPNTNLCKMRIADMAFESCLKTGRFTEAIDIGQDLVEPYRLYYGYYHGSVGYFLFEYGQILLSNHQTRKALAILTEAYNILQTTFGDQYLHKEQLQRDLQTAKFLEGY